MMGPRLDCTRKLWLDGKFLTGTVTGGVVGDEDKWHIWQVSCI